VEKEAKPQESTPEPTNKDQIDAEGAKTITVQGLDGKDYNLSGTEAYDLMRLGIQQTIDGRKSPKEEPVTEPAAEQTIDEKYDELKAEFHAHKQGIENASRQRETLTALDREIGTFDVVKEIAAELPEVSELLTESIRIDALARQTINPRLTIADATRAAIVPFQKVYIGLQKSYEEKMKANGIVRNSMGGIVRSGSGIPTLDKEKEYTRQDVKDGTAMRTLQAILEQGE